MLQWLYIYAALPEDYTCQHVQTSNITDRMKRVKFSLLLSLTLDSQSCWQWKNNDVPLSYWWNHCAGITLSCHDLLNLSIYSNTVENIYQINDIYVIESYFSKKNLLLIDLFLFSDIIKVVTHSTTLKGPLRDVVEAAPSTTKIYDKKWDLYIFTIVLHVWTYTYKDFKKSAFFLQQNVESFALKARFWFDVEGERGRVHF